MKASSRACPASGSPPASGAPDPEDGRGVDPPSITDIVSSTPAPTSARARSTRVVWPPAAWPGQRFQFHHARCWVIWPRIVPPMAAGSPGSRPSLAASGGVLRRAEAYPWPTYPRARGASLTPSSRCHDCASAGLGTEVTDYVRERDTRGSQGPLPDRSYHYGLRRRCSDAQVAILWQILNSGVEQTFSIG
jgi:hypothetical protein